MIATQRDNKILRIWTREKIHGGLQWSCWGFLSVSCFFPLEKLPEVRTSQALLPSAPDSSIQGIHCRWGKRIPFEGREQSRVLTWRISQTMPAPKNHGKVVTADLASPETTWGLSFSQGPVVIWTMRQFWKSLVWWVKHCDRWWKTYVLFLALPLTRCRIWIRFNVSDPQFSLL